MASTSNQRTVRIDDAPYRIMNMAAARRGFSSFQQWALEALEEKARVDLKDWAGISESEPAGEG